MKRSEFLTRLGLGAIAATMFPKIMTEKPEPKFGSFESDVSDWEPDGGFNTVMEYREETGNLLYLHHEEDVNIHSVDIRDMKPGDVIMTADEEVYVIMENDGKKAKAMSSQDKPDLILHQKDKAIIISSARIQI